MKSEFVSEREKIDLAVEYSSQFPHLSFGKHLRMVELGYGNCMGREEFLEWYDRTVPLLTSDLVLTRGQILDILTYDSQFSTKLGVESLSEILHERAVRNN
ncbi:MAG: hypothetical protein Q8P81_04490 [Nanoarchaeota archaeon]|nr:hypothetical protein [Nanoarchaeota archaeon]